MEVNKTITYNINVNDLIRVLKEYEYVKIKFYKNGGFAIVSETACGYPDEEAICVEKYDLCDFVNCNSSVDKYANWLESWCGGSLDVYKSDKPQCKLYKICVNWVK